MSVMEVLAATCGRSCAVSNDDLVSTAVPVREDREESRQVEQESDHRAAIFLEPVRIRAGAPSGGFPAAFL
jgi:hypothetical protein